MKREKMPTYYTPSGDRIRNPRAYYAAVNRNKNRGSSSSSSCSTKKPRKKVYDYSKYGKVYSSAQALHNAIAERTGMSLYFVNQITAKDYGFMMIKGCKVATHNTLYSGNKNYESSQRASTKIKSQTTSFKHSEFEKGLDSKRIDTPFKKPVEETTLPTADFGEIGELIGGIIFIGFVLFLIFS